MSETYVLHHFKPVTAFTAAVLLAIFTLTPVSATWSAEASPAQSRFMNANDGRGAESEYVLRLPAVSEKKEGEATGSIIFVGNATVLIRYGGLTILTDPNFLHRGDHVHLGYGLTSGAAYRSGY